MLSATSDLIAQKAAAFDTLADQRPVMQRFGVHLSPLSMFFGLARLRTGVFARLNKASMVLDLEYGNKFRPLILGKNANPIDRFYGFRPEFRYHLPFTVSVNKPSTFGYLALEIPVTYYEERLNGGSYRSEDGFRYAYERGIRQRFRMSGILKLGCQFSLYKSFYLDLFAGLGYGFRRILYVELENKRRVLFSPEPSLISPNLFVEGNRHILEIALGFRLGIAL